VLLESELDVEQLESSEERADGERGETMDQRTAQSDPMGLQAAPAVAGQARETTNAVRAEPDAMPDAVRSPDGTQRRDGSVWRDVHAEQTNAVAVSTPALVAVPAPTEYPVVLHWKFGSLTATPTGVAFDMTRRSTLVGRHTRDIHREFAYADLREVEVHPGRASIGVVLRTREDEIQGCQGCTNADEVDAFLAVLVQHDVEVLVGSATNSVMIGRYTG
jgi:hypothetical protein